MEVPWCKMMCCDEYQDFLNEFGGIILGYEIVTKEAHRKYLKDMVTEGPLKFKYCPYCGSYAEKSLPKNLEG